MWIPKSITDNENTNTPFTSNIFYSEQGKIAVSGLEKIANIKMGMPYGVVSVPPKNTEAVVIPVGNTAVICGIVGGSALTLEEGEVGLFSKGGASLLLKNDGTVVINGRVFEGENV